MHLFFREDNNVLHKWGLTCLKHTFIQFFPWCKATLPQLCCEMFLSSTCRSLQTLRACQDSGRSQNPPRGPCSLKAKCAAPLFVPLRKLYLKWHETDDFVPWSLGEMSDWGIPHVLGRCSFVTKQQVFFSALQQRGDRFVFWLVAEDRRGVLSQTLSS